MSVILTIDRAGRIVIPRSLRKRLHLDAGDTLQLEATADELTLRPVRGAGPLEKEHGVWVFRTGKPLANETALNVLEEVRAERDLTNLTGQD